MSWASWTSWACRSQHTDLLCGWEVLSFEVDRLGFHEIALQVFPALFHETFDL